MKKFWLIIDYGLLIMAIISMAEILIKGIFYHQISKNVGMSTLIIVIALFNWFFVRERAK